MCKTRGHFERMSKFKPKQDIKRHASTTKLLNYVASDSKPKEIFALDLGNKPNSDCHDRFYVVKIDQPASILLSSRNISVIINEVAALFSFIIIHNLHATIPENVLVF